MYSEAPIVNGNEIEENVIELFDVERSSSSIHLELDVNDPESVREISSKKAGRERTEYALNALTVGLLSLRHARGQVDADAVRREGERILGEMGRRLKHIGQE